MTAGPTQRGESPRSGRGGTLPRLWQELVLAFKVLTILPLAPRSTGHDEALARSAAFFPVVGAVLGAATWGLDLLLAHIFGPLVRAGLLLAFLSFVTGGMHLDGLADTCDGLFSRAGRERALEIMRDSRIGALGASGLIITLLLKFSLLATLTGPLRAPVLFLMPIAGRQAMILAMAMFPAARPGSGLGGVFTQRAGTRALIGSPCLWSVALALAWAMLGTGSPVGLATRGLVFLATGAAGALACGAGVAATAARRLGGLTGDVYGAASEVGEVGFLLVITGLLSLV